MGDGLECSSPLAGDGNLDWENKDQGRVGALIVACLRDELVGGRVRYVPWHGDGAFCVLAFLELLFLLFCFSGGDILGFGAVLSCPVFAFFFSGKGNCKLSATRSSSLFLSLSLLCLISFLSCPAAELLAKYHILSTSSRLTVSIAVCLGSYLLSCALLHV